MVSSVADSQHDRLAEPTVVARVGWPLIILLAATILGSSPIVPGVLVADPLVTIAVAIVVVQTLSGSGRPLLFGKMTVGLSWFVLYVAVAAAIYHMWFSPHLEPMSFLQSLARLLLVVAGVAVLEFELRYISDEVLGKFLRAAVIVAFIGFVAQFLGLYIENPVVLIEDPTVDWDPFGPLPRLYGFFTEPSTSAIFCAMVLVCLGGLHESRWWTTLMLGVMLIGGFALSALLLGVGIGAAAAMRRRDRWRLFGRLVAAATVLALLIALISPLRQVVQVRVLDRVTSVESDGSSSSRLVDSWTAAVAVAEPVAVGPGLGTFEAAVDSKRSEGLRVTERIVESGGGWNMFANVLAVEGLLGVAVFTLALARGMRTQGNFVIAVSLGFVMGAVFQWFPWFFLVLLARVKPFEPPNNTHSVIHA